VTYTLVVREGFDGVVQLDTDGQQAGRPIASHGPAMK
jgi:hypothetical protein